ncbi:MAG: hypothetical protein KJS97_02595 [Alphaproteobacteria bacterium]|nr:hypothetical protein [Alphaproteobacteria bacterium]
MRAALAAEFDAVAAASGLPGAAFLREALLDAHAEPHRAYHGLAHVRFLLVEITRRRALIAEPPLLIFAAWMHDAVYVPFAKDNEARSAAWARQALAPLGALAERVGDLILKTADHHAGEATPDEALFLDMDFAILGAPAPIYRGYAAAIRREYAAAEAGAYCAGRAAFLRTVLAQPRMFRTMVYEAEFARSARANLAWEIAELEAGRIPTA